MINVPRLHRTAGSGDRRTLEPMLSTLPAPAYQSQASVTSQQQQQQLPGSLPALLSSVLSTDRAADGRRPAQQTMQAQQAQACQDAQEALEGHGAFIDVGHHRPVMTARAPRCLACPACHCTSLPACWASPRLPSNASLQITILGQGSFGVVAKATDTRRSPPQEVAIKLLPRGDLTRVFQIYIKREILHQSSLRHPFVIAIKQARNSSDAPQHACRSSTCPNAPAQLNTPQSGWSRSRGSLPCSATRHAPPPLSHARKSSPHL